MRTTRWWTVPRDIFGSFGAIARFGLRMAGLVYSLPVFRFLVEILRQAGILILGSAVVILGMCFILGLTCGI